MTTPTLAERLTEQFYAWELRGRGWQEFPRPVALEPPFRPFSGYFLPPVRDDAHRPGFLSSLFAPPRREEDSPEIEEPEPAPFLADELPRECIVSLPLEKVVGAESAERFLLSLSGAEFPHAFELVGLPGSLRVQLASRPPDTGHCRNQLRAFFPEVSILEEPAGLREMWTGSPGESIVVHFGLAREFMLPLASFRSLDPDPLLPLFGALTELEGDEAGLVQVLFERAREPWAESVIHAVVSPGGEPFFADFPELTKLAREKISRPLYAACLRIAAKSGTRSGAWRIIRDLAGTLAQFGDPGGNEFVPLAAEEGGEALTEIFLRTSRRPGMLLGVDELASLVHLPSASVKIPKLLREVRRSKAAPHSPEGVLLGENLHHGRVLPVLLPAELRLRHLHVIGASGTGKSTLLLDLISQDIASGRGVGVLDPHGDLIEEILGRIPEERQDDVILFDPSDTGQPVAWNILEAHSELERTLLSSDLVGIFRRFSTSWGDQMTSVLGNAVLVLLEVPGSTLLDLREFLVDRPAREKLLGSARDPYLVSYWRHEFPLAARSIGAILTRLDGFLRSRTVRAIVGARESRLDLRAVVDRSQIFLAKLSQGAIGEENASLLGSLLVSKFHQIAISRQETRREERRPFFLYADECQEVATPSMALLLSGARKYGLGLTLAHQDLRQLDAKAPEVASALMANAGTQVAFRVGERDAKALAEGLSFFGQGDLLGLRVGEAIARIENSTGDCNLRTRILPAVSSVVASGRREAIVARSRALYAVRIEPAEVEVREAPPSVAEVREIPQASPRALTSEPQVVLRPAVPPPPPPKRATRHEEPVPPLGRGGPEHQYLQELVKRWGEANGYRVVIEEPTPDGKGSVDVALRNDAFSLACEISVTSTVGQEVGNVQKCLEAGFHEVAVLALKRPRLSKIEAALKEKLPAAELARVHFLSPEELFTMLAMRPKTRETVVGGYKVKVRHEAVDPEEAAARYKALTEVVAKSVRRMKGGEKP
jgi:type IV secretory system conjugative DNA transfer VirD4/TraG family protein/type IV secretion system coupling TraD/TrwB family protein